MNTVFEHAAIGNIQLKNRIFRSATHEGMADKDGRPIKEFDAVYKRLAEGGVGAIITGFTAVQKNGRGAWNIRMFDSDNYIEDYQRINKDLKENGTPVILQLAHCGGCGFANVKGEQLVAPSAIKVTDYPSKPRELKEFEIREIIENFIKAIKRAQAAQFDGVQLHAAHSYLLAAFLSPYLNRRNDEWGGSTKNRFRIISEIVSGARKVVGDFPIFIKISAYDGMKNGLTVEETVEIAKLLQECGIDCIEVSCGGGNAMFNTVRVTDIPIDAILTFLPIFSNSSWIKKKALKLALPFVLKKFTPLNNYNVAAAEKIKQNVDIPVIVVGGIRKIDDIQKIINTNQADFVSMSRPFIIEPGIVNKFKLGTQKESRCINCGYCLLACMSKVTRCFMGKMPD